MNILHASTDPTLLARLKEMLASSSRADIAVGYFFMSGFEQVADDLVGLEKVRILLGRSDREVLEQMALGLPQAQALRARLESDDLLPRRQRTEIARQAVNGVAAGVSVLPQDDGSEAAVGSLRDTIEAGRVEVRAYPRGPLHAKAYLCWYANHAEPGAAVVGSSNLTLAGFTGNTELNVRVTGDAEMEALREWFDSLWKDSQEISQALLTELNRSWALARTPPYHVYLKALHELYYTEVAGGELPLPQRDEELANFQIDAVSRGLAMIDAHGGCYIGDVVGLGKTYIGAELLRQLRVSYPQDGPPLILCPAGLRPMWQRFNERFGLGAEVVSHSMIRAVPDPEFDEELGRYVDADPSDYGVLLQDTYPNRGPVLVDEAHNFRNINQRSRGLRDYLEAGDHKVILLSATPQNLGPMDIYRQLTLFLDDTDHGLSIEPLNLEEYFRNARRWLAYRAEDENYRAEYAAWQANGSRGTPPMNKPTPPDVPHADIQQVLAPVFIRRRRRDIRELYGDTATVNDQPVRFPDPELDNVAYRLDKVYAKAGALADLQVLLDAHKAARYRAVEHLTAEAALKDEYRDLFRAGDRIPRLMRALLFKRLESSIEAFRSTLESLLRSNRNFRQALEDGYVPIGNTATRLLAGQSFDADDVLDILRQEEERRQSQGRPRSKLIHSTDDFKAAAWLGALDADYAVLSDIRQRIKDITPEDDDKLQTLRQFLDRPEVASGKVLIFSEAETTVEYLFNQLNPSGQDSAIARLTGSTRDSAQAIIRRFAPKANAARNGRRPRNEIRVLLATDIVSEGQNLQDCARVLNYDLHWNPVRLIQRFGRVDRIGTEHDVIHLHNMWPDTAVDAELSLTERLGNRIQSFHDLIGLDSKLLSESERLNAKGMYRIYADKKLPEQDDALDEVAANQRAVALLQRIQRDDPELWQTVEALPDGIRSALQASSSHDDDDSGVRLQNVLEISGMQMPLVSPSRAVDAPSPFENPGPGETLVLLSAGNVKGCYAVADGQEPRQISPAQFAAAAECDQDAPAQPLPRETNARVMRAFEAFQTDFRQRLGRARRPRNTLARRYVSRQLNLARQSMETTPEDVRRIDTLRRIYQGDLTLAAENALDEIRRLGLQGSVLVTRLEALRERYRLNPPEDSDQAQPAEPQVVRIVCSDGLV